MNRVLTIAQSEFLTLVRTKAFIIGIFLMPVLMFAFSMFMGYAERHADTEDRPFAVVDGTGALYDSVAQAAEVHNREAGIGDARTGPHFLPSRIDLNGESIDDVKVDLSDRIKKKNLFAFVEIPPDVLDAAKQAQIHYYAENTSYERLPDWLLNTLNEEIAKRRFDQAGVDRALVSKLTSRTQLATFGLVQRGPDGKVAEAKEVDALVRFGVPFFFLILM